MSWQCVCRTWKGRAEGVGELGVGEQGVGVKDLGTDEFTSLSKWNDIVVNLGATKSEPNVGQDKTNSIHDGDKEASQRGRRERERGRERRKGCKAAESTTDNGNSNNKAKQQQIACPSALDATQYTTHSYLLLSGSRCNVPRGGSPPFPSTTPRN